MFHNKYLESIVNDKIIMVCCNHRFETLKCSLICSCFQFKLEGKLKHFIVIKQVETE